MARRPGIAQKVPPGARGKLVRRHSCTNAAATFAKGPPPGPNVAKKHAYPARLSARHRGIVMQTRKIYQVQHWPDGQWDRGNNWRKVEAGSEKEAAEMVCGLPLTGNGRLAQL